MVDRLARAKHKEDRRGKLLSTLRKLAKTSYDPESNTSDAIASLLTYLDDPEIEEAFNKIKMW